MEEFVCGAVHDSKLKYGVIESAAERCQVPFSSVLFLRFRQTTKTTTTTAATRNVSACVFVCGFGLRSDRVLHF